MKSMLTCLSRSFCFARSTGAMRFDTDGALFGMPLTELRSLCPEQKPVTLIQHREITKQPTTSFTAIFLQHYLTVPPSAPDSVTLLSPLKMTTIILCLYMLALCVSVFSVISNMGVIVGHDFQPEGCGFDSRSCHHVGTLGKSFTYSCLCALA